MMMIAGGDCCDWTRSAEDGDEAADIVSLEGSQSSSAAKAKAAEAATATLAAAASAISTSSSPRRRRRRRQRQRSANNTSCTTTDKNAATSMPSRSTSSETVGGSGHSIAGGTSYCGGGSAFSIASTSGSSSSSNFGGSVSSATGNNNPSRACSLPLSPASFSIFSKSSSIGQNDQRRSSHTPPSSDDNPTTTQEQCASPPQQQQGLQQQHEQHRHQSSSHHHFLPSDFTPQTWLKAVHETVSSSAAVRYCSAGAAAALTAVIVIHPLALMGAVATAAAGAGATAMTMWAVGFFHDLERGYQIWSSEEFGKLFWKDSEDANNKAAGRRGSDDEGGASTVVGAAESSGSRLFVQEGEVEVQQLEAAAAAAAAAQPTDQPPVTFLGEMGRSLLDEEQKVDQEEDALNLAEEGDADNKMKATAESPERLTSSSSSPRSKNQRPSSSRRGYGIRKIRSNPVPSIKPLVRRIKMQNGMLTRQRTPTTVIGGLEDDDDIMHSANPPTSTSTTPSKQRTDTTSSTSSPPSPLANRHNNIDRYFPPLEICVIHSVKLPGLDSASQFFNVFFADDAPYSMKDFQKRRGDVDIVYEPWEDCKFTAIVDGDGDGGGEDEPLFSFKEGDGSSVIEPLPRSSTRQRRLTFNTLTKSYFGPAYAKATKIQRVTQLQKDRILVIENVTLLADIPFSDRFRVLERWILEVIEEKEVCEASAVKDSVISSTAAAARAEFERARTKTACNLAVFAEVQILKSCSWESQIRKKASETFTDVVTDWCKSAVVALEATEEQKRKRQRLERESSGRNVDVDNSKTSSGRRPPRIPSLMIVDDDAAPPSSARILPSSMGRERSQLFAEHKRNFDELDKLISQGDLEWCSVEVSHSSHFEHCVGNVSQKHELQSLSLSATVLENLELDEYEITSTIAGSSIDDDDDEQVKDGSHRKAATLMLSKSRKLLRRLSSRRGGTYQVNQQL